MRRGDGDNGGDPLWPGVAQGRVRYERCWALLATVGGEAVWGSSSGVLAITRGPESKMSAAGAQSDSTHHPKYHPKYDFRLPASFGDWRRPPRGTRCCGLDAVLRARGGAMPLRDSRCDPVPKGRLTAATPAKNPRHRARAARPLSNGRSP